MKPTARLALAGAGAAAGAAIATVGARSGWETFECLGREVELPQLGTTRIPGRSSVFRGHEFVSGIDGLTLLALMFAVLVFFVGPRTRVLLLAAVAGTAGWTAILGWTSSRDRFEFCGPFGGEPAVSVGAGRALTVSGGVVAALAALAALSVAGRVPRMRLPERGADERVAGGGGP